MNISHDQLTLEKILQSSEIEDWLGQFPEHRRTTAIGMLLKLRFIKRDAYVDWVKKRVLEIGPEPCALYAVRKFTETVKSYWDASGEPASRPAQSLGSEDLVQSVVAGLMKGADPRFLDHPGIEALKNHKVRNIVLIDDSLGSGKRVSDFIDLFMGHNKTLMSWWSYGFVQLHVVSLVRSHAAVERILRCLPGSDHPSRVHPKSKKLHFVGHYHYDEEELQERWGVDATQILNLCDSVGTIPPMAQRGFGSVMSNLVFHHSVPDNIPGVFWYPDGDWHPLFPNRMFPGWLSQLLADESGSKDYAEGNRSAVNLLPLLRAIQRGTRAKASLARSIGLDPKVTAVFIGRAQSAGFVSPQMRLTLAGKQFLRDNEKREQTTEFDRSLYVPSKWCVGRGTIQPSRPNGVTRRVETESKVSLLAKDGDAGQASLERTDARSAAPPLSIITQQPSRPRVGDDAHGPKGEMDK